MNAVHGSTCCNLKMLQQTAPKDKSGLCCAAYRNAKVYAKFNVDIACRSIRSYLCKRLPVMHRISSRWCPLNLQFFCYARLSGQRVDAAAQVGHRSYALLQERVAFAWCGTQ